MFLGFCDAVTCELVDRMITLIQQRGSKQFAGREHLQAAEQSLGRPKGWTEHN